MDSFRRDLSALPVSHAHSHVTTCVSSAENGFHLNNPRVTNEGTFSRIYELLVSRIKSSCSVQGWGVPVVTAAWLYWHTHRCCACGEGVTEWKPAVVTLLQIIISSHVLIYTRLTFETSSRLWLQFVYWPLLDVISWCKSWDGSTDQELSTSVFLHLRSYFGIVCRWTGFRN